MSIPYVAFGNDELAKCPDAQAGQVITCPVCGQTHVLTGSEPPMLLFYGCNGKSYLGGIAGKLVTGVSLSASGTVERNNDGD